MSLKLAIVCFFTLLLTPLHVSAKYWVAIAAYNAGVEIPFKKDRIVSPGGHAYIVFIKEDIIGKRTLVDQAWGFYTSDGSGILDPVPGYLCKEINRYLSGDYDNIYKSEVSLQHYNTALGRINEWRQKKQYYALNVQTCVDFVRFVAAGLPEMKVPPMNWNKQWPKDFVLEIKRINTSPGQTLSSKLEPSVQIGKIPCSQYPEIKDDFVHERKNDNWHSYSVATTLVHLGEHSECDAKKVFNIMLSSMKYVAPAAPETPVKECTRVALVSGAGLNLILTKIDYNKLQVTNYTMMGHVLHRGKVTRTIVRKGCEIIVLTEGVGYNSTAITAWLNNNQNQLGPLSMNSIWSGVDELLKTGIENIYGDNAIMLNFARGRTKKVYSEKEIYRNEVLESARAGQAGFDEEAQRFRYANRTDFTIKKILYDNDGFAFDVEITDLSRKYSLECEIYPYKSFSLYETRNKDFHKDSPFLKVGEKYSALLTIPHMGTQGSTWCKCLSDAHVLSITKL